MAALEKKKLVFLTGTRADFGKIKPLITAVEKLPEYEVHLFVTGMHMNPKYGHTVHEVRNCGFENIYCYINGKDGDSLDEILKNTISGFGQFVKMERPDMIVVHGDRIEALAGALVGSLNNTLVGHIEGGEVSGTIDEHIRHAVSKMAHVHFGSNELAKKRLRQMGEHEDSIFVIGSPDRDIMISPDLPDLATVRERYEIPYDTYGLFTFHPITTEIESLRQQTLAVADALEESGMPYIGIYPNNDPGTDIVFEILKERLFDSEQFRFFPSVRFEYFLTLIKNAHFVIGNSSVGIREAPFYGVPSINIGTRQNNRDAHSDITSIHHANAETAEILTKIDLVRAGERSPHRTSTQHFGMGSSSQEFVKIISEPEFWNRSLQKQFYDI